MEEGQGPNAVAMLMSLAGDWRGHGVVSLPTMPPQAYDEEMRFAVRSPTSLDYWQRATDALDGALLHSESGIWRVTETGSFEVTVALPGAAEVSEGAARGARLGLSSTSIGRARTGARLTHAARAYELDQDAIRYEVEIATEAYPPVAHLRGEVRRTRPSSV